MYRVFAIPSDHLLFVNDVIPSARRTGLNRTSDRLGGPRTHGPQGHIVTLHWAAAVAFIAIALVVLLVGLDMLQWAQALPENAAKQR